MDDKKLDELYRMVQENNQMLRSARRSAFVGSVVSAVWWLVILVGIPYVTWLYLEPYLGVALAQYGAIQSQSGALSSQAAELQKQLDGVGQFQKLLQQFLPSVGQ